jgi:hypothetical protein
VNEWGWGGLGLGLGLGLGSGWTSVWGWVPEGGDLGRRQGWAGQRGCLVAGILCCLEAGGAVRLHRPFRKGGL